MRFEEYIAKVRVGGMLEEFRVQFLGVFNCWHNCWSAIQLLQYPDGCVCTWHEFKATNPNACISSSSLVAQKVDRTSFPSRLKGLFNVESFLNWENHLVLAVVHLAPCLLEAHMHYRNRKIHDFCYVQFQPPDPQSCLNPFSDIFLSISLFSE